MSNAGQAALTIVGAAVGFAIAGPLGAHYGWMIGYGTAIPAGMMIGSMVGSALFPTNLGTVYGPRLGDLRVQSSSIGAPIPLVYGTYGVSGNLIWSTGLIEEETDEVQGGKGGPTQTVTTYTYKVNCAVGVCEGPITKVLRIWADTTLLYDDRPLYEGETPEHYEYRMAQNQTALDNLTIYLGDEEQLPDPTIESYNGVGNVSGFRGLAYIVFNDFQLANYGNRIPQFRFEVEGIVTCSPEYDWDLDLTKLVYDGNWDLWQAQSSSVGRFTDDGLYYFCAIRGLETAGTHLGRFVLSEAYNPRTMRWDRTLSPVLTSSVEGVNIEQTRMLGRAGINSREVHQFNLTTPGDVTTLTYATSHYDAFYSGGFAGLTIVRGGSSFAITSGDTWASKNYQLNAPWNLPVVSSQVRAFPAPGGINATAFVWADPFNGGFSGHNIVGREFYKFTFDPPGDFTSATAQGLELTMTAEQLFGGYPTRFQWHSSGTFMMLITGGAVIQRWDATFQAFSLINAELQPEKTIQMFKHALGGTDSCYGMAEDQEGRHLVFCRNGITDQPLPYMFDYEPDEIYDMFTTVPAYREFQFDVGDTWGRGFWMNEAGTYALYLSAQTRSVYLFRLTTEWDVESAEFVDSLSLASVITDPFIYNMPATMSTDGTRLYVVASDTAKTIYEFTLATPWTLTGAVQRASLAVGAYISANASPLTIIFSPSGRRLYMLAASVTPVSKIVRLTLGTNWDIDTAVQDQELELNDVDFISQYAAKTFTIGNFGRSLHLTTNRNALLHRYVVT